MKETINLFEFFTIMKKHWKLIIFMPIIAAFIGMGITKFLQTPIYQASTQMIVNQKSDTSGTDITLIQNNIDFIGTYSMIIKSPAILDKVIADLKLEENVDQLTQRLSIESQEDSQVFTLTVEDNDPARAVKIANTVSEIFQKEIPNIMNVDNVNILAEAEMKENPTPVSPSLFFNLIISIVVGFLGGITISLLIEMMDNTYKNEQDVEAYLGLPVLGSIDKVSAK